MKEEKEYMIMDGSNDDRASNDYPLFPLEVYAAFRTNVERKLRVPPIDHLGYDPLGKRATVAESIFLESRRSTLVAN